MPDQTQQLMHKLNSISDAWVFMKEKLKDLDHDNPQTAAICDAIEEFRAAGEQVGIVYKLVTGENLH